MKFEIKIKDKRLIFDSKIKGIRLGKKEYLAGKDGELIYGKIAKFHGAEVELQMSTNTSTLIPALRVLQLPYNKYFDKKDVVNSQNDISFYWKKSKLAAYYNRFSTDNMPYEKRGRTIRKAVDFIINSIGALPLNEEFLNKVSEPVKLLGFYQGFPIFDDNFGFAKLLCRLGIHVGNEAVMISTPLDKYGKDVYQLAEYISEKLQSKYSKKKNRVVFERDEKLDSLLNI